MFLSINKKNNVSPCKPQFCYIKVGFKMVKIIKACFRDARRGDSNEYPQSKFLSRNKKNNVYPCKPQFYYIKAGFKGVKIIYRYVFVMLIITITVRWSLINNQISVV